MKNVKRQSALASKPVDAQWFADERNAPDASGNNDAMKTGAGIIKRAAFFNCL